MASLPEAIIADEGLTILNPELAEEETVVEYVFQLLRNSYSLV